LRRRRPRAAAHRTNQAHLAHQPPHPTPSGPEILAAHLLSDFPRPVDLVVLVPDPLNDGAQDRVLPRSERRTLVFSTAL
jgi:hypothetical protein